MAIAIDSRGKAQATYIEHQMLDHIKSALRVTIDWQAPTVSTGMKLSSVRFAMQSFRRHLERLMRIEEEGGYLYSLAERRPNLQAKIERLASEHTKIRQCLCRLVPELESLADWQNEELARLCSEITDLLAAVDAHDNCEVALLQDSLLYDVGGEG